MSNYNVYLKVPEYLAQWITHTFGNPVSLIKDSPEMRVLNELVVKTPAGKTPDTGEDSNVTIPIPFFKGKDPSVYNYLHQSGKVALTESFSSLFKRNLWEEMSPIEHPGIKQATLIYAYMEKHGIDEKHWDTVAQIYQRMKQNNWHKKQLKTA